MLTNKHLTTNIQTDIWGRYVCGLSAKRCPAAGSGLFAAVFTGHDDSPWQLTLNSIHHLDAVVIAGQTGQPGSNCTAADGRHRHGGTCPPDLTNRLSIRCRLRVMQLRPPRACCLAPGPVWKVSLNSSTNLVEHPIANGHMHSAHRHTTRIQVHASSVNCSVELVL